MSSQVQSLKDTAGEANAWVLLGQVQGSRSSLVSTRHSSPQPPKHNRFFLSHHPLSLSVPRDQLADASGDCGAAVECFEGAAAIASEQRHMGLLKVRTAENNRWDVGPANNQASSERRARTMPLGLRLPDPSRCPAAVRVCLFGACVVRVVCLFPAGELPHRVALGHQSLAGHFEKLKRFAAAGYAGAAGDS